jgi:diguanylate cyclase (GGDEF)-like protein
MNDSFGDARLEELKVLSEIDRRGEVDITPPAGPLRDMLAFLVSESLVNDLATKPEAIGLMGNGPLPPEHMLETTRKEMAAATLRRVLEGSTTKFRLSHLGRVRLSELKQALRSGKEREPFGILWDVRHWEQDLEIAILDAREGSPLALAYLDMNGLKQVNDSLGHDAGDRALKSCFQAVAAAVGERGQAYRLGGDEVLVVLPNHNGDAAAKVLQRACTKLMGEGLESTGKSLLSIAAGIITSSKPTASPDDLRAAADKVQSLAKAESKKSTPRPSVIAVEGTEKLILINHDAGAAK